MRRRGARPVRRRGPGKRAGGNTGTAPRADPYHVNIRLEEHKLCLLVMIGVRADGRKELVALADGYRESTESWADLLRDCARRGMRAPVLAVGDGALGFWGALREVFPQTREQRCWFHKIANVLAALPKSAHPGGEEGAGGDLERRGPPPRPGRRGRRSRPPTGRSSARPSRRSPTTSTSCSAFYDYPAEHWIHLRTTNPIESHLRHRPAPHQGHPRARAHARPGWRWRSS